MKAKVSLPVWALVAFCVTGCNSVKVTRPPQYEYEVVTVEEQALENVSKAPLEFVLPYDEDSAAWERSHLFFKSYASGSVSEDFDYPAPGTTLRSQSGSADKYLYEIERSTSAQGCRYVFHCSLNRADHPTAIQDMSEQNCRNLSRFVREGHLELTLLDR